VLGPRTAGGAEARHELGERRVRLVTLGQDRAAVRRRVDRGPRHADRGVVPGEAELVGTVVLVRHEVEHLERLEREEPVRDAGRDHDPVVRRQLARLDDCLPRPVGDGPDIDERHERASGRDDPVVELAAVVVEPAQDAGRRAREVGLDEARLAPRWRAGVVERQGRERRRAPQLPERAAAVRVALDGAVANAAQARRRAVEGRHREPAAGAAAARWRRSVGR
jgi:hypothetical protein